MTPLQRSTVGPVELVEPGLVAGRIVPWNTDAVVVDLLPAGPERYVERWERGAFDAQARSNNRGTIGKIELTETHLGGLGKVGYALEFDDRPDGQHALFRVLPRHRDDVAQMIDDGLDGLSVMFHPKRNGTRTTRDAPGGMQRRTRTDVHLLHVALVAEPSYAGTDGARVLAMRDVPDDVEIVDEHAEMIARRAAQLAELEALAATRDKWAHLRVT